MRLELGTRVTCTDGPAGELADVVVDPTTKRVTHLVVEPRHEPWTAQLVPVELADRDDAGSEIALHATVDDVRRLPAVREIAYLRTDGLPIDDPDWDVGIDEVYALPYYTTYELEPVPLDYAVTYDRVPKGEVEIRRGSSVLSADGHELGDVDGFVVDAGGAITHLVLERGHLWGRREVTIPIGAVAAVANDVVSLDLSRDDVAGLPAVRVERWPR